MRQTLTFILFTLLSSLLQAQQKDSLSPFDFLKNGWSSNGIDAPAYRYYDGKKCNGSITDTFPNGKIKHKGFYINGQLHGETFDYYEDGQIESMGKSDTGQRVGEWKFYYKDGEIKSKIIYKKGWTKEAQKVTDYYQNGKVESKYEYGDDLFILYHYEFNEKGDTTFAYYPINKIEKIYEFFKWYSNGTLKEIGQQQYTINKGWKEIGIWKWFDESGKLVKEEKY